MTCGLWHQYAAAAFSCQKQAAASGCGRRLCHQGVAPGAAAGYIQHPAVAPGCCSRLRHSALARGCGIMLRHQWHQAVLAGCRHEAVASQCSVKLPQKAYGCSPATYKIVGFARPSPNALYRDITELQMEHFRALRPEGSFRGFQDLAPGGSSSMLGPQALAPGCGIRLQHLAAAPGCGTRLWLW